MAEEHRDEVDAVLINNFRKFVKDNIENYIRLELSVNHYKEYEPILAEA